MPVAPYTLEQAEADIAALRGQVTNLGEAHSQTDGAVVPNAPDSLSHIGFGSAGHQKYISGADGNTFNTGRLSLTGPAADQSVSSAVDTLIGGLACPVTAGTYRIGGTISCLQGGGAFAQNISFHGPATSAVSLVVVYFLQGSGASNGLARITSLQTVASPAFAGGSVFWLDFGGVVVFSASGTFSVQASEGTSGHTFSVLANSFCDLMPVT